MAINDGGVAFPCEQGFTPQGDWNQSFETGMSLRDYFAAKAMLGLLGYSAYATADDAILAKHAYAMADAMLAERAKAEGND